MLHEIEAMAIATGELIYEGEVATTFSLLPDHKEKTDPLTRKNMEAWTRFMDSQYDPDTLAAVTEECIDKRYSWHGKDAADGHSDDKSTEHLENCANVIFEGFTDFHITNRMFGEGDRLVNFWHMQAVHTGDVMGVPPSGKPIEFRGIAIGQFRDGKMVEEWEYFDDFVSVLQKKHNEEG